MVLPNHILGVALMDDDHARLEALLSRVGDTQDEALPDLLTEIETETRAHFRREEDLMRAREAPILHCHVVQHELFLSRFSNAHEAVKTGDMQRLRHFLGSVLPGLLEDHVNTVDRVTAGFLRMDDPARSAGPVCLPGEPELRARRS